MKTKSIFIILTLAMFLVGTACAGNVKTSEDQAIDKVNNGNFVKEQKEKTKQEKELYKNKVVGSVYDVCADYDSDELTAYKNKDKIHIRSSVHFQRSIRIPWNEITNVDGFKGSGNSGQVLITHVPDIGIPQSWAYSCFNDGGYAYFDDLPFSEIIIGGALGTYVKNGTVTYQTSPVFSLGNTFEASNINYINATITPIYEETGPYDIPTNSLVGWWKFDEGSGINVSDSSGNGNHGTANGGMNWTSGKYNDAGSFDGIDDYVVSPVPINNTDNVTVILSYGKVLEGNPTFKRIFVLQVDTKNFIQISGSNDNNTLIVWYANNATDPIRKKSVHLNNATHQLCIVTHGETFDFYADCVAQNGIHTGSVGTDSESRLTFGARPNSLDTCANITIDNAIIYNRTLSESEIKQIYYDNLQQLKIKTNSNSTYSNYVNGSDTVNIPYGSSDSDITSLTANVLDEVTIDGVIVRDYGNTTTPFNVSTDIGYTENTTLVDEALTYEYYQLSIRFIPGNDYESSTISYTSDNNAILASDYLTYDFTSTNTNATLAYDTITRTWTIDGGQLTEGKSDVYNIMAYLNTTNVIDVYAGFGDEHVETYPITGNETNAIGSRYVVSSDSELLTALNGSDIWVPVSSIIIIIVVIIFSGMAIRALRRDY